VDRDVFLGGAAVRANGPTMIDAADIMRNAPDATAGGDAWHEFLYRLPAGFLSVAQRLQFMLMIEASWDEFHAPTVVGDLLRRRDLWHAAMMFTDGHPLWPLPYLDEGWNADTLYVLSAGRDDDALKAVADRWLADAAWVEHGKKPRPYEREVGNILRVWWA
jgi:hypothetical protein